jgi:hypothetical protein
MHIELGEKMDLKKNSKLWENTLRAVAGPQNPLQPRAYVAAHSLDRHSLSIYKLCHRHSFSPGIWQMVKLRCPTFSAHNYPQVGLFRNFFT